MTFIDFNLEVTRIVEAAELDDARFPDWFDAAVDECFRNKMTAEDAADEIMNRIADERDDRRAGF